MPNFERRLTALERRLHVGLPRLVVVEGGLPSPDGPRFGSAGEHKWERLAGEPLAVFEARVLAIAAEARVPFVILGGVGPIGHVEPPAHAPGDSDCR